MSPGEDRHDELLEALIGADNTAAPEGRPCRDHAVPLQCGHGLSLLSDRIFRKRHRQPVSAWGNLSGGRIRYRREKTKRKAPVLIDIPVHPDLAAVLDTLPRDRFTFLQTGRRQARSPNGLGHAMRRWCDAAGLSECTSHGLRKACARRLAEAGATPNQIAAVTGHTTLKEVSRYTAAANRAGLADDAFGLLSDWTGREQTLTNHPEWFARKSGK